MSLMGEQLRNSVLQLIAPKTAWPNMPSSESMIRIVMNLMLHRLAPESSTFSQMSSEICTIE